MAAERVIIDTSVALKWFHSEEGSEIANQLLRKIEKREIIAFAPDLIIYEVTNAWVRGMGKDAEEIPHILETLQNLGWIIIGPSNELLSQAATFAEQHPGVSVYDATYVVLAMQENATFVTADRKLHKRVGEPLTRLL